MFYTLTPMTEHTGLEFRGLDLTEPLEPEISDALNRAFVDYHVLVIRGQTFTPPQFIAAAELFGELQPHDKKELHVPGYPQINYVSNEQNVPGKRYISGETFHTDHSNHPAPPKATLLYPVSLPTTGGDTQYVNMHEAYDDLPEAAKRRIEGLKAVHVYQSKHSPRELRPLGDRALGRCRRRVFTRSFASIRTPAAGRSTSIRCGSSRLWGWRMTRRSNSSAS